MKDNFINRQIKRQEEIEELTKQYGSIDAIPFYIKEKYVKESKKDMPMINSLHIKMIEDMLYDIKFTITLHYILIGLLSIGLILKYFMK